MQETMLFLWRDFVGALEARAHYALLSQNRMIRSSYILELHPQRGFLVMHSVQYTWFVNSKNFINFWINLPYIGLTSLPPTSAAQRSAGSRPCGS